MKIIAPVTWERERSRVWGNEEVGKEARNPMLRPAQILGAGTRLHPPAFGGIPAR